MINIKPIKRFFINLFTSGRYKESEFGMSDYVIQYALLNYMLIGGILGIGGLTAAIGWQWSFFSRLICYYIIFVSFVCILLARTKIRLDYVSLIYVIALSLFVIIHVWDGKTHGSNFMYVFSIPLASILLLGMLRGVIITIIVGVILSLQLFVPGFSRFIYYSDFALRVILGYFIVSSMMIAIELTRKSKDRKIEEQRKQLDELYRTKNEFFALMSHEMKTPLTVIATDIQLAESNIEENKEEAKILMRDAWQETMRLADQVTGTLAFTRSQQLSKEMSMIDFGSVIEITLKIYETLLKKQGNVLSMNIEKLPAVYGNTDMLTSMLINILANANRHTKNGNISVKWSSVRDDKRYCLEISDNGEGIPADLIPHVFERGVSGTNSSGLGLAIVKSIMELHKGEVTLTSEVGKGTTVRLFFPTETEHD